MADIDYFFTALSPYTYLAGTRLEEIAARHGASIAYKPMDITAVFSRTGGMPLADRHPARQAYRLQDLARQARRANLPLNVKPAFFPVNPAPSSYALIAAQSAQGGDLGGLVHGLARACWAEDRDISDDGVSRDCLSRSGFDPGLADSGLLAGAEAYARNTDEAVERGAFGAPFYIVNADDARFWGQDRLHELDAHLAERAQ